VARAALHLWEEPCISGARGSGTIFFAGCSLGCVFCQNAAISRGRAGAEITPRQLADICLRLQEGGAHNINLVTPMHFTPAVLQGIKLARPGLKIPVCVNTGGYDAAETVRRWDGVADIWLPDFKFHAPDLAVRYANAPDYFAVAAAAITEMHRQQPRPVFNGDGVMQSGLIVRHLMLPGGYRDSLALLRWLKENLPPDGFYLSLMRQFTPTAACKACPEINRKVTTFEYEKALEYARKAGFSGFFQGKDAAGEGYVPDFDLTGVLG
jgi:putative pyruvate formate lyase activating enzyme